MDDVEGDRFPSFKSMRPVIFENIFLKTEIWSECNHTCGLALRLHVTVVHTICDEPHELPVLTCRHCICAPESMQLLRESGLVNEIGRHHMWSIQRWHICIRGTIARCVCRIGSARSGPQHMPPLAFIYCACGVRTVAVAVHSRAMHTEVLTRRQAFRTLSHRSSLVNLNPSGEVSLRWTLQEGVRYDQAIYPYKCV